MGWIVVSCDSTGHIRSHNYGRDLRKDPWITHRSPKTVAAYDEQLVIWSDTLRVTVDEYDTIIISKKET